MIHTLRFKMTASFLIITVLAFTLLGVLANILLKKQFESYVIDNLAKKNEEVVATLESRYSDWGNKWDVTGLENIGVGAMSDGLILRVTDASGTVLWDAMVHNSGMCAAMLQTMADNMQRQNAGFNGGYTEKNYGVVSGGSAVGTVSIGYYGPYFYTDNDIEYLNTLNMLILVMICFVGVASLIFGTVLAKRLADPIAKVIKTAECISDGDYSGRLEQKSSTREILELTDAINALAERLQKQETLRKRLTADVAHELRTPLANLQSHLEAMLDGVWEADEARLQSCHEEAVRLTRIVADLEKLTRFEGEGVVLNRTDVDVPALVNQAVTSFESELKNKSIEVKTALQDITLRADGHKIMQVIVNLLSNAVKYTPPCGKIEITAKNENGSVQISVKDTGIGISEKDLPYIFERFYRADPSRSRDTGGSGIGLAIVKSIVAAHGGTIRAISEPGKGSTFIVELPG